MPSEWPLVRLEDVTTILGDGLHGTPSYDDSGDYYFINGNNLSDGRIVFNENTRRVTESESLKHRKNLNDRTVLVSINGTLGNVALYRGEKVVLGKSACYFNVRHDVDRQFVRYVITSAPFQSYIHTLATGSTIKNVSLRLMRDFSFHLPPLKLQKEISAIFVVLDDRINLLHETNATLEAIAQALFKSWFVDFDPVRTKAEGREPEGVPPEIAALFPSEFENSALGEIPKGWRVGTLADIALLNPESWTAKNHPATVLYIDLANTKDNVVADVAEYAFDEAPSRARRALRDGDTIVGTVRPGNRSFAYIDKPPSNLTASTGFAVLRPSSDQNKPFLYLAATQDSSIEQLAHVADGAAYPAVRPEVVAAVPCVVPSDGFMRIFHDVAAPLLSSISENQRQAQTLATLRDTLLPRLMSGKLRIPEMQKAIEEASA